MPPRRARARAPPPHGVSARAARRPSPSPTPPSLAPYPSSDTQGGWGCPGDNLKEGGAALGDKEGGAAWGTEPPVFPRRRILPLAASVPQRSATLLVPGPIRDDPLPPARAAPPPTHTHTRPPTLPLPTICSTATALVDPWLPGTLEEPPTRIRVTPGRAGPPPGASGSPGPIDRTARSESAMGGGSGETCGPPSGPTPSPARRAACAGGGRPQATRAPRPEPPLAEDDGRCGELGPRR